jgi:thiol-disulfide isomerase/thioredoxin
MNKKLFTILCIALVFGACKNNSIRISGKLEKPVKGEYIFLDELQANSMKTIDSVQVSDNGNFSFKKEIKYPMFYLLKISNNNFITMLVEPGEKVKIIARNDSLNNPVSVSGSKGTTLMLEYNKNLRNTINQLSSLNEVYQKNINNPDLSKIIQSLDSMAQIYLKGVNNYTKKYIDDNITSMASLVALYQQVAPQVYVLNPVEDLSYFVKVDSSLSSLYPESETVKSLHDQVKSVVTRVKGQNDQTSLTGVGSLAPEINLPTPKGDSVKLSSTRGKIVLLDFWASWCTPCRLENPNLVKAYNMFRSKGFNIFQVSLDKTKEDWMKGIQDDNLGQWIHVSDVKYWNSVVVPLYKIESIPHSLLLDKDGKILATNLRGEQLQTKLAELFR